MARFDLDATVQALLDGFQLDPASDLDPTIQKSLFVARALQQRSHALQTPEERKQQTELDRMIRNSTDKATLTAMTDQAFRSQDAARSADQLVHVLDVQGVPRFFSPLERTLLRGFQSFGDYLPGVTIPLVKEKMRQETANVIIPAEADVLREHLALRRREGVRMNVNFLGEAILGDEDAERRMQQYLRALTYDEIEVVSVKISTLFSQVSALARASTVDVLCERLGRLFQTAARQQFVRADGTIVPKFIYLDMEEYRDLSLTAEAFMKALDQVGFEQVAAGIALQAYIPDSFRWQRTLTEWAMRRTRSGGRPITVRLVKGANMEMERVEASLAGWPQAPFLQKQQTDANYKRMLQYGLAADHIAAARIGIASHNLFDISYGLVLAFENGTLSDVQFEMLEGMANHQRRALQELTRAVLLYAPACRKQDFIHGIGYLVRRLDENTGPENFLRHAFKITVDSKEWSQLEGGFLRSLELANELSDAPRRQQNRSTESFSHNHSPLSLDTFDNEPDTDFSLPHHEAWVSGILESWSNRCGDQAIDIPLVVAGRVKDEPRESAVCLDPSRPGVVVARYRQANLVDIEDAVQCACSDLDSWRLLGIEERNRVLRDTATEIRRSRAELIGAALAEGGKTIAESDPEVSEAIDFVEFYAACAREFAGNSELVARPRGVVVVVAPWNFPIAIPCGGVAAALAAGNCVILKPASKSVLVAHLLCECFFRAGVSRRALQLIPCSGGTIGSALVSHPLVDTVILTGGTETALRMLEARPEMRLLAETGGKNATIVTAMADRDQAIKHVIRSAFGHVGQKCSATSLLLLQDEVYDDVDFRAALVDAARSLPVGSVWNPQTRMGPLISPPTGDLKRALTELEPGESWALRPEQAGGNEQLYKPGIKWDVARGSVTHLTEFFGPVLGVMRFRTLAQAIEIVNETGYGLTSGLESLDDREKAIWLSGIRAGNLYINRPTTGAIVYRQPFGGMGKSAVGPGIKAGGPNYVIPLMRWSSKSNDRAETKDVATDLATIQNPVLRQFATDLLYGSLILRRDTEALVAAIAGFDQAANEEFLREHDFFRLLGQDNLRRYQPISPLCIRVDQCDSWQEIVLRVAAAHAVGARSIVSSARGVHVGLIHRLQELTEEWGGNIEFLEQTDEELAEMIEWGGMARIRYAGADRVPLSVRRAVVGRFVHITDEPVMSVGRIELLWYVQEQSISADYHRYGNLGSRSSETRRPTR